MTEPIGETRQSIADLGRALRYVRPFRGRISAKVGYTLLSLIPAVVLPWPAKVLVDHVIQDVPVSDTHYPFFFQPLVALLEGASPAQTALAVLAFSLLMLLIFGGWANDARDQASSGLAAGDDLATQQENAANQGHSFMGGLLGWLEWKLTIRLTQDINHHYRSALFERIQHLPMARLDDRRIGDAIYRLMYDTPQITEVVYRIILTPITAPLVSLATVLVMATTYDVWLVWVPAALLVPLGFAITVPFSWMLRRRSREARERGAEATSTLEEGVANVLAVQSLGGQPQARDRFDRDSWESYGASRVFFVTWIAISVVLAIGTAPVGVYVFYVLTDEIFAGRLTVGDLGVIFAYYGTLAFLAAELGRLWVYLQDNVVGLRRVFELMDSPSDHQPASPIPLPDVAEGFRFEDVGFAYPDGTRALEGVSFEARRGEMLALVGPAGAGKTTLAQLFPRFLSPDQGHIAVDGHDLAAIDRGDLRERIAFVFQEPVLFDATLAENIRVGRPDASLAEVREAAGLARAADFIEALPDGYDTPLGRAGGRLSVGQKQRVSIARALVRDAPVLVLDEPSAALDPETEALLVATLREVSRDKLVVVIAHRLSTIRSADQILFLRDGRVLERGTHDDLVQRQGGAYRHFVELQAGDAAA